MTEGDTVGSDEGAPVGIVDGVFEGPDVGEFVEGRYVGIAEGLVLGDEGDSVG
jgi:hypothetical protein